VVITLLKTEIPDSDLNTYTYRQVRAVSGKGKRFGKAFGQVHSANSKCAVCGKTVYAMEFIGAAGKAFHKACFKCTKCKSNLRADNYATLGDVFYCKTHYEEAFKLAGGYNFQQEN